MGLNNNDEMGSIKLQFTKYFVSGLNWAGLMNHLKYPDEKKAHAMDLSNWKKLNDVAHEINEMGDDVNRFNEYFEKNIFAQKDKDGGYLKKILHKNEKDRYLPLLVLSEEIIKGKLYHDLFSEKDQQKIKEKYDNILKLYYADESHRCQICLDKELNKFVVIFYLNQDFILNITNLIASKMKDYITTAGLFQKSYSREGSHEMSEATVEIANFNNNFLYWYLYKNRGSLQNIADWVSNLSLAFGVTKSAGGKIFFELTKHVVENGVNNIIEPGDLILNQDVNFDELSRIDQQKVLKRQLIGDLKKCYAWLSSNKPEDLEKLRVYNPTDLYTLTREKWIKLCEPILNTDSPINKKNIPVQIRITQKIIPSLIKKKKEEKIKSVDKSDRIKKIKFNPNDDDFFVNQSKNENKLRDKKMLKESPAFAIGAVIDVLSFCTNTAAAYFGHYFVEHDENYLFYNSEYVIDLQAVLKEKNTYELIEFLNKVAIKST